MVHVFHTVCFQSNKSSQTLQLGWTAIGEQDPYSIAYLFHFEITYTVKESIKNCISKTAFHREK